MRREVQNREREEFERRAREFEDERVSVWLGIAVGVCVAALLAFDLALVLAALG